MKSVSIRSTVALAVAVALSSATGVGAADRLRILQTNAAGDNIHIIDPATDRVVARIEGIEVPHGVTVAPDGSRVYVTDESERALAIVDGRTLRVIKRVPLTGRPNNVAVSKDGRRVYAAIRTAPNQSSGGIDVIDTVSVSRVKNIPVGDIHNVYVTPDGKYVVGGSTTDFNLNVIDQATEELAWALKMPTGVRPMAFVTNPDGSTKFVLAQQTEVNGFTVVDFATRKLVKTVLHPALPAGRQPNHVAAADTSHGIAVSADNRVVVAISRLDNAIYSYALPDFRPTGTLFLSGKGQAWVTITPDGRKAYVANAQTENVSVVDIQAMKELTTIPVGYVPKRNTTAMMLQ